MDLGVLGKTRQDASGIFTGRIDKDKDLWNLFHGLASHSQGCVAQNNGCSVQYCVIRLNMQELNCRNVTVDLKKASKAMQMHGVCKRNIPGVHIIYA